MDALFSKIIPYLLFLVVLFILIIRGDGAGASQVQETTEDD
jgi:hypothetical protein